MRHSGFTRASRGDRGAVPVGALLIALAVAGGLVVGSILGFTGAVDLLGESDSFAAAAPASYYECPGDLSSSGALHRGDRVFATGRDQGASWVQVRSPRSSDARVWIAADDLDPDADLQSLPVVPCAIVVEVTVETTTTIPGDTTTTIPGDTTTTTVADTTTTVVATTTTVVATTTTTVAADTTPPSISTPGVAPNPIWEQDGAGITCPPGTPRQATVSTTVTDTGGVASVTASWVVPGLGTVTKAMSGSGSTRTALFGPYPAQTWPENPPSYQIAVTITIQAIDSSGNTATRTTTITVTNIAQCFG